MANTAATSQRRFPPSQKKFGKKLELLFNQRLLTIRVANVGQIRADHLVVSVATSDGWINDRVVYVSPGGPAAPIPKLDYLSSMHIHRNLMRGTILSRVGRHEFETTRHPQRSRNMEATCEDFRSGQEYLFEGVVAPSSEDEPLLITVTLTASNLRGERTETSKLEKRIVLVEAEQLVDLATLELKQAFPTKKEIERLLKAGTYDAIEAD